MSKELLDRLGVDPATVVETRKQQGKDAHAATFDTCGKVIEQALDYAKELGFGNATKLYVMQGATEPGLFAVAMCVTYPPDIAKCKPHQMPFDSVLFAALFTALLSDCVSDTKPKHYLGREMEAAHKMFYALTGRVFRDCFIETCSCANCKARRKIHGIKFNPDKDGRWL